MLDLGLGSPAAGAEEAQVSAPSGLVARRPSWTKRLLELGEELSLDLSTPAKSSRALRLGRGTAEEWATPCAAPGTPTGSRSRSQSCHRTPQRSLSCRSSCSPQKAPWRSPRCRGGGGPLSARRRAPPAIQTQTPTPKLARARRASAWGLRIATPSSSPPASPRGAEGCGTPQPQRSDFRVLAPDADVGAVLFDFDGTLTSVPGMASRRTRRQLDLRQRAPLLEPRLRALRDAGLSLGIISKSSEATIRTSLVEAGLCEFFDGPLVANAVGFDGKAGFIEELVQGGSLRHLGPSGLRRVLLVDDDVQELEHARARGVQVYAAPEDGGLQEWHLEELLLLLGLQAPTTRSATTSDDGAAPTPASCDGAAPAATSATSTTMSWASPTPSPASSPRSPTRQRPGPSPAGSRSGQAGGRAVGGPSGAEDTSGDEGLLWMTPGCPDSCAAAPRGAGRLLFGRAGPRGAARGPGAALLAW